MQTRTPVMSADEKLHKCYQCPQLLRSRMPGAARCNLCGCFVVLKTRTPGQHCPMGKW